MRLVAVVALVAGVMAAAGAGAHGTAPRGEPRFAPAPGWTQTARRDSVIAATVPILDDPRAAHADLTVQDLPAEGIVITASARRSSADATYDDSGAPERSLPLDLADADVRPSFEAQPNPSVPEYLLWQRVDGYFLDVRVFFGTQEPGAAQLAEAQAELARLVLS